MRGTAPASLLRILGAADGAAVTVGVAVGMGIFRTPAEVAAPLAAFPPLILVAWAVGGLLAFLDGLVLAELAALFPRAGGWYVYLREGIGRFPAFLWGWAYVLVIDPGSNAALTVVFGEYCGLLFGWAPGGAPQKLAALGAVALIYGINALGLRPGARAQAVLTWSKVAALVALGVGAWTLPAPPAAQPVAAAAPGAGLLAALGLALLPVLWTYDGYANSVTLGEEVRDPGRSVPRGLLGGILALVLLYAFLNASYLHALGAPGLARAISPAGDVATALLGPGGGTAVLVLALLTALGSLNGAFLSVPRVPFAMARDGALPAVFTRVSRGGTPRPALLLLAGLCALYTVLGDFRTLVDQTVFVATLGNLLVVAAFWRLRRTRPDAPRPFRAPMGVGLAALLLVGWSALLANTLLQRGSSLWGGAAVLAAGLVFYAVRARRTAFA